MMETEESGTLADDEWTGAGSLGWCWEQGVDFVGTVAISESFQPSKNPGVFGSVNSLPLSPDETQCPQQGSHLVVWCRWGNYSSVVRKKQAAPECVRLSACPLLTPH